MPIVYQAISAMRGKFVPAAENELEDEMNEDDSLVTSANPVEIQQETALRNIPGLLKEEENLLYHYFEIHATIENILQDADTNPFIAIIQNHEKSEHLLMAEKQILMQNLWSFSEALLFFLAFQYVFNVKYSCLSLEFCQSAMIKAGWHDPQPSRKVCTLLKWLNISA